MNSKEALEEIKDYLLVQHDDNGEEEDCIRFGELEPALIEPLERDLEVLEILKRIVKIVDYSKYPITSPDNQLVILSGGKIMNVEDYDKIKRWLENDYR